MADIEYNYQERIRQIKQNFAESIYDAIASRDATAALRALRKRNQDLRGARRDRNKQASDAQADYARQTAMLKQSLADQRAAAIAAYEEQLREVESSQQDQIAELERSLRRQEEDQIRHDNWRAEDMQRQYSLERQIALINYRNAENDLRAHLERKAAIAAAYGQGGGRETRGPTRHRGRYAEGGQFVTAGTETVTVGEAGPELVTVVPIAQPPVAMSHNIAGTMRHDVAGAVRGEMAGLDGKLSAAVNRAVLSAFREILR